MNVPFEHACPMHSKTISFGVDDELVELHMLQILHTLSKRLGMLYYSPRQLDFFIKIKIYVLIPTHPPNNLNYKTNSNSSLTIQVHFEEQFTIQNGLKSTHVAVEVISIA